MAPGLPFDRSCQMTPTGSHLTWAGKWIPPGLFNWPCEMVPPERSPTAPFWHVKPYFKGILQIPWLLFTSCHSFFFLFRCFFFFFRFIFLSFFLFFNFFLFSHLFSFSFTYFLLFFLSVYPFDSPCQTDPPERLAFDRACQMEPPAPPLFDRLCQGLSKGPHPARCCLTGPGK